ncbi:MAG TPA: PAS domain S-box protein [Candidatus Angelobacter sp.]|nr:PAS domain S-box protein [Candidatus Angelobacter sp.]
MLKIGSKANAVLDWISASRGRLYTVLVLGSAIPLLLFLYTADRMIRTSQTRALAQQSRMAGDQTALIVERRLARQAALVRTVAANPAIISAVARDDRYAAAARLHDVQELRAEAALLAIYDTNGAATVTDPETAAPRMTPEWFNAVLRHDGVYATTMAPVPDDPDAVALTLAIPIRTQGRTSILAAGYTFRQIASFFEGIPESVTKWVTLLDQNGIILFKNGDPMRAATRNVAADQDVQRLVARKSLTEWTLRKSGRVLLTLHPLTFGWGLLIRIPASELDKVIWNFERPLAMLGLAILVVAVGLGGIGASLYRRMRESEKRVRQIITSATDAFISVDRNDQITEWNPRAEALFGWSKADVTGQPLHTTIVPPRYREQYLQYLKHLASISDAETRNSRLLELRSLHRSGREISIEVSISRAHCDGGDRFNAFVRDITERKLAQEEIRKLNADLHSRVLDLEARNRELESFSYSISHDVRAPLRHIAGFSDLLAEECEKQISPTGHEYLGRIQNAVARTQRLIEDLLRFSRLGEQGLNQQRTKLNEVTEQVVASLQSEITGRAISWEISTLPEIKCDTALVTQVFWNLISNAIKFTSTRSPAVISIGQCEENGDQVLFVRDNGVGFDMRYASRLFAPFQRLHGQDEFEGTGVGLAIAERIIHKHGGCIWARAVPDQGATFFFRLWPQKNGLGKNTKQSVPDVSTVEAPCGT